MFKNIPRSLWLAILCAFIFRGVLMCKTYYTQLRASEPQIFSDSARHLLKGQGLVYDLNLRDKIYELTYKEKRMVDIDEVPIPEGPERLAPWSSHPPGYILFLAATFKVFNTEKVLASRIIQIILDSIVCFFIFGIASRLFEKRTALVAAWIFALWPSNALIAGRVGYYGIMTFFLMGALYFLIRAMEKDSWKFYLVSALFLTGGVMVRQDISLTPLVWAFGLLLIKGWKRAVPAAAILGGVMFVLGMFPWAIRNHHLNGKWYFMNQEKWEHIYDAAYFMDPGGRWNLPEVNTALKMAGQDLVLGTHERDAFFKEKVLNIWRTDFWAFFRYVVLRQLARFTIYPESILSGYGGEPWLVDYLKDGGTVLGYLIHHPWQFFARFCGKVLEAGAFILAALGLWIYRRRWKEFIFLYGVTLYFFAAYAVLLALPLYMVPPKTPLLIFTAAALVYLSDKFKERKHARN